MSQAQLEKFYAIAANDPRLVWRISHGAEGPEDIIRNAVAIGRERGFEFTFEEAEAWLARQRDLEPGGELAYPELGLATPGRREAGADDPFSGRGFSHARDRGGSGHDSGLLQGRGLLARLGRWLPLR